jgi:hypothetical protein
VDGEDSFSDLYKAEWCRNLSREAHGAGGETAVVSWLQICHLMLNLAFVGPSGEVRRNKGERERKRPELHISLVQQGRRENPGSLLCSGLLPLPKPLECSY